MSKRPTDRLASIEAADSVIWELSSKVCHECEGRCWTLAATACGMLGAQFWETWISYRTHMDTVAALGHIAGVAGTLRSELHKRELRAAMVEMQTPLFE